ncbi:hypothetical protein [Acetobacter syzygii]|uniref:Uncharacterized protein n=1 Tax=Acetobacter syzygii TaxID=146476 RepID=A0A270B789_9PROT|nr:hypothetical protein [Acetobacter syzygii]NSL92747.1 hypothetical protein [Acetobacter syzygii]PAL20882.1 hypothetical protein B9K05_12370 [Acetobacter syzygii]PAL22962.1 hypothetical protein B9K04_12330 [Acetobacter syzygii]
MTFGPFLSFQTIAQFPEKVRKIYQEHDIRIRPRSDLARMLDLCTDIDSTYEMLPEDIRVEVNRAYRVLHAIVDCADQKVIGDPLRRIAANSLKLGEPKPSSGKDLLFELELLQYMRYRRLTAQLGEPDIVVVAPFGEYFVACKTIYSLKNFETQLSSGTKQIEKRGVGCIAFNLEPHMFFEQPLRASNRREAMAQIKERLIELYDKESWRFDKKLKEGRLDGVMLMMSCTVDVPGHSFHTFTNTVFYSRSNIQGTEAQRRFEGFRSAMSGPLTTRRMFPAQ